MGYTTRHKLQITTVGDPEEALKQFLAENEEAAQFIDEKGQSTGGEGYWEGQEGDLKAFSKKHPGLLFTLEGEGEEAGDIWAKYFLNGKMQESRAEVKVEPFDPAKMK